jgi:hypothetical protein
MNNLLTAQIDENMKYIEFMILIRVVATLLHLETGQTISRRFVCEEKLPDVETRVGPLNEFQTKYWRDSTTRRSPMCPAGKTNGIQNKKDPGSYHETKETKNSFKQIINDYGLKQINFKLA